jgi:hypothetical protein
MKQYKKNWLLLAAAIPNRSTLKKAAVLRVVQRHQPDSEEVAGMDV